jgi:hypothetical protein
MRANNLLPSCTELKNLYNFRNGTTLIIQVLKTTMNFIFEPKASEISRRPFKRVPMVNLLATLALLATSCTLTKPPTDTISRAEIQLRTAVEARADEIAPLELQSAREKLAAAKNALSAGRHVDARRLAEAAEVEAELAEAKADADITRRAADGLRRSVDALRQEMERGTRGTASQEKR